MTGQQLSKAEKEKVTGFLSEAADRQAALLNAMQIKPDVFASVCANVLLRYPDVARCSKQSLYDAVCRACEIGIIPDGKLAAIVPIRMKGVVTAQFWPMIDGLLLKVRQNIKGISLQAHNVFRDDKFTDERGSDPKLVHIVNPDGQQSEAALIASYATAHMPNNPVPEVVVMYKAELESYKKKSGPWVSHPLEMYRLRPFKRLLKRLPLHPSFSIHIEDDEDETMYGEDVVIDQEATPVEMPPPPAPKTQTRRTKAAPKQQQAELVKEPPPPDPDADDLAAMPDDDNSGGNEWDNDDDPF